MNEVTENGEESLLVNSPLVLGLGVFLLALSSFVFEIATTRLFSVVLWYHFGYFVVSLALFGIGAGGVLAHLCQSRVKAKQLGQVLGLVVAFFAIVQVVALFILSNFDLKPSLELQGVINLAILFLLFSLPFMAFGFCIAITFRRASKNISHIYAADLIGASLGCVASIGLLKLYSGPEVILFSALISGLAMQVFVSKCRLRLRLGCFVCFVAFSVVLYGLNHTTSIFSLKYTKSYVEREDLLYEKWSPLARITVYPSVFWQPEVENPFGWGLSTTYEAKDKVPQMWIEQDASAGTPITQFQGNFEKLSYLTYDITAMPYYVKRPANVFIIGPGGGRDILTALLYEVASIDACEINPVIYDLMVSKYADYSGGIYNLPQVDVKLAEARSYISTLDKQYDLIQIPLIDSWAATMAGAFSLAENNLYTIEAFKDYYAHLREEGILAISRYLFDPRNQTLRVATSARAMLEEVGVEEPHKHIAVIGTKATGNGMATVLIKKSPFSETELENLKAGMAKLKFSALFLPGTKVKNEFSEVLYAKDLDEVLETYYYDIRPCYDDKPFFFQMIYPANALDILEESDLSGQRFNYYAYFVLFTLLGVACVLVLIFYFLPLLLKSSGHSIGLVSGFYFILIGLAFMAVEIPLLQKGAIYLGHPTYSMSIILFSLLFATGVGSYFSQAVERGSLSNYLTKRLLFVCLGVPVIVILSGLPMYLSLGYPFAVKVVFSILLIALIGIPMGCALPLGLRALSVKGDEAIPWAWALNGAASVLGSVISMAIAMSFGYNITLIIGAILYLFAILCFRSKSF